MSYQRKKPPRRTPVTDRQIKAKRLRLQGMTYKEVGGELGVSGIRASQLVAMYERKITERDNLIEGRDYEWK